MNFIESLQNKRSQYNYADQARTQAESLKQLSAGIYTEEERFVYELLQNAVDAFIDTEEKNLDIRIEIKDDILCFMHNGAEFSECDIEGLCDVGRSNKASNKQVSNKKKVGYKGIGFKSVFMQGVDFVCVKSGNYCFKFDKNECFLLMPNFPDGELTSEEIPWQIIPIMCQEPRGFNTTKYNVATYIKTGTIKGLVDKIINLLSNPQFLLFLNASNISIKLYNEGMLCSEVGRETIGDEVHLLVDKTIASRWILHTTDLIPVNNSVREDLRFDFNTPQKLKEATHFEISFAISINEEGGFEKIENSVIYTFLPTSYRNLGLPFLVNANFITDAGRQQIHQNSKWNNLIFESIPEYFLKWISTLSTNHKDYYKILPNIKSRTTDYLTSIFDDSLRNAISKIAFIPRLMDNTVIKSNEAIIDKIGIANTIDQKDLIRHINEKYNKNFSIGNFIDSQAISLLKQYGVFVFEKKHLPKLFEDTAVFNSISIDFDVKLIEFLYSYDYKNIDEQNEFRQMLKCSKFILDENNKLGAPQDLFFPSDFREGNDIVSDTTFINNEVYSSLTENSKDWLKYKLEIKELSNLSFIDFLYEHRDYINKDNAIRIGKFLFKINKEENIFESVSQYKLKLLKFLSKRGSLKSANELYLGDIYKPELTFEGICKDDIFISSEYLPKNANNTEITEWKLFLLKFGVREDIVYGEQYLEKKDNTWKAHLDRELFESAIVSSEKYSNTYNGLTLSGSGWHFSASSVEYKSYPLLYLCDNYQAAKVIISRVLFHNETEAIEKSLNDDSSMSVSGSCGFWSITISQKRLKEVGFNSTSHIKWLIENKAIIPTSQHTCDYAKNVYSNSIDRIWEVAGPYLPILDVDLPISDAWLNIFPLKRQLILQDYLTILSYISNDSNTDNKERISCIYERLVECGYQNNTNIKEWGKTNKLMSSKGEFLKSTELSYITIDGFKNASRVYIGKIAESNREGVLCLLKNFGVKVITKENITANVLGVEKDDSLKVWLIKKLQYLAVLKEEITTKDSYHIAFHNIEVKINDGEFYHCKNIELSYGNENDVIQKMTFAQGRKFYFTGNLSPSKLEPLMHSLASFLGIKGLERELLIILITNDHNEITEFLKDKGYNTIFLIEPEDENPDERESIIINNSIKSLDHKRENEAQLEAQKYLMESRPDWRFPSGYGTSDEKGYPMFYSTVDGIEDEQGTPISIVLKSYKKRTEPFHINPEEWEWVVKNGAKLLVYTRIDNCFDIVEIPQKNLISGQNIQLTFSTKNLDLKEHADRISLFADILHYFSELTFDFEQFYIAPDSTKIRDIEFQNKQAQNIVTDEDI